MSTFAYVAFEDSGRRLQGVVDAPDSATAFAAVEAKGYHVLQVKEKRTNAVQASTRRAISRADIALFTRRLADLARAGIPLDRSLMVAGGQADNPALVEITEKAIQDVRAGLPVSDALAKYPKQFPPVFTMTLKAGESSGQFPQVASRLAAFQQVEIQRRAKIIAALVYPTILLVTAVGVVGFMIGFVVPKLAGVFDKLGTDLPITTVMLLNISSFVVQRGLYLVGGLLAAVFFIRGYLATTHGQFMRDRLLLNLPLFGKVVSQAVVSRFSRLLATLLYGGVPILEALQIAGAASGNRVFEVGSKNVQNAVREGRRIADSMDASGVFPNMLIQMVSVGEETGDLPQMLNQVSETLDFEVENSMAKLTALVEPLIVLTMGFFVGFVVLSILLPVYQAQELIK
jgi:type II secretory pathway component PulF